MPIPNYDGETFVAFTDISGFKEMMKTREKAVNAINSFYSTGYSILQQNTDVHGMFISDCAVLFAHCIDSPTNKLKKILAVIEQLNRNLLQYEIMLTCSIAYGHFNYHQRLEFSGIEKNPVYGNAYVNAFLDNETGQPKIQPGQCRIIKHGLPDLMINEFSRIRLTDKHWDFFWMVNNMADIPVFNNLYEDTYQQKYKGMFDAIKKAVNNNLR